MRLFLKSVSLTLLVLLIGTPSFAGRLNLSDSNNGKICKVTSMTDFNVNNVNGSLRRAVEQGFNVDNSSLPSFCTEKIVFETAGTITLQSPIKLNNKASSGFILEKASGVKGAIILDAKDLEEGACAIEIYSDTVTIKGIMIKNAPGSGICIKKGSKGNNIENVTVTESGNGVLVNEDSEGNTIRNNRFFENTGFGVLLKDADRNEVTRNTIYGNGAGAIDSPATNILPTLEKGTRKVVEGVELFQINGEVEDEPERVEIYRETPLQDQNSSYLVSVGKNSAGEALDFPFTGKSFNADIQANAGEKIFAVAIASDGTTSPSTESLRLRAVGNVSGGGTGSKGEVRDCTPDQIFASTDDFDGDGIFDVVEDKNADCLVQFDEGETDPKLKDSDGDGLDDGIEDFNKSGTKDDNESDPRNEDTDGDRIFDGVEDFDKNGRRKSTELDPNKTDTDGDGILDYIEDTDHDGLWDVGEETDGTLPDTDIDGVRDGDEDKNHNGQIDPDESDPKKSNTDGDRLLDNADPCSQNPSLNCKVPCIPGETPADDLDNDDDVLPDFYEDLNHDCQIDPGETDPFDRDSDGDSKADSLDSCPNNPDLTCIGECNPSNINQFSDSDNDGKKNIEEDINGNCFIDPNESDPFDPDTDKDGTLDGNDICRLDPNPLCNSECRPGVTPPPEQDSDGDGVFDVDEDINKNCLQDINETSFRKRDTDDDGTNDNQDQCPLDADEACTNATCIPGEFIAPQRDSDRDGIKDVMEDLNRNCIREVSETDAYNADTDGDGLADGIEDRNQNGLLETEETDPRMLDTDRDGIQDGVEDRNKNGIHDFDELDPTKTDTDEDTIPDFMEDRNQNGTLDTGETNGARNDTDQDQLLDGAEDVNHNGIIDAGETDPRASDTDGDGANDGQEVNRGTNPIHASSSDFNRAIGRGCSLNPMAAVPDGSIIGYVGMLLAGLAFRIRKKS